MMVLGSVGSKSAVLAQLDRILASTAFRNSKRHSNLFRHIVEQAIAGNTGDLKERALGVQVFGRRRDYDNNADPIVRISAGDLRKRIAQYYHEPGHENELRIELPVGSYVPMFLEPAPSPHEPVVATETLVTHVGPPARRSRRRLAIMLCVVLAGGFLGWRLWDRSNAFKQFWQPFVDAGAPVTICVARSPLLAGAREFSESPDRPRLFAWTDLSISAKVASLFTAGGQGYQLKSDESVNLDDLRQGPAVLVGAFNDVWSLRLTENLRFEFRNDGNLWWIQDRKNASSRAWSVDVRGPGAVVRDYAVISRLLAGRTGTPILVVGGIRGCGTEAAGEFVTNRTFLSAMAHNAPAGWQRRNMQIVIETEVIEGHSGPPKVLAIDVW